MEKGENIEFDFDGAIENIKQYFEHIQKSFPTYEERMAQKKMIFGILKSYKEEKHAVIEAPTGTGKSMGYILPFLAAWEQYSKKTASNEEEDKSKKPKLVIATNTIALQEQLMNKDIPDLQKVLPHLNFKAALVKGKRNFICKPNFYALNGKNVKSIGSFDTKMELEEFKKLEKEITINGELIKGDKTQIETKVSPELWDKITIDSNTCTKKQCPFYQECFFYRAKESQKNADILVANHALFFADLSTRIETNFSIDDLVLPSYDYLVFDEAHHLEDVASDFLGKEVSRAKLKRLCSDIHHKFKNSHLVDEFSDFPEFKLELLARNRLLEQYIDPFFIQFIEKVNESNQEEQTIFKLERDDAPMVSLEQIDDYLEQLNALLERINKELPLSDECKLVIDGFLKRISGFKNDLSFIINQEDMNSAYWIESPNYANRHLHLKLVSAPITVNKILRDFLFEKFDKTIVLTSATLGTDNSSYLNQRLGITSALNLMFHSPFDYQNQSKIYIPKQTVNPKSDQYNDYLKREIECLIEASKGRALVLFTSNYSLNSMSDHFRPVIEKMGYSFFKQGDMSKSKLISSFKDDTHSVLFATSSYWEGIDVPGEALSLVVITKLPFEVPDRPIFQARIDQLREEGLNPFNHYQVPLAVIKFKQGFGRLIRKSTDKGVVAVLDPRIIEMRYGKTFLNSLPPVPITRDIEEIKHFL